MHENPNAFFEEFPEDLVRSNRKLLEIIKNMFGISNESISLEDFFDKVCAKMSEWLAKDIPYDYDLVDQFIKICQKELDPNEKSKALSAVDIGKNYIDADNIIIFGKTKEKLNEKEFQYEKALKEYKLELGKWDNWAYKACNLIFSKEDMENANERIGLDKENSDIEFKEHETKKVLGFNIHSKDDCIDINEKYIKARYIKYNKVNTFNTSIKKKRKHRKSKTDKNTKSVDIDIFDKNFSLLDKIKIAINRCYFSRFSGLEKFTFRNIKCIRNFITFNLMESDQINACQVAAKQGDISAISALFLNSIKCTLCGLIGHFAEECCIKFIALGNVKFIMNFLILDLKKF